MDETAVRELASMARAADAQRVELLGETFTTTPLYRPPLPPVAAPLKVHTLDALEQVADFEQSGQNLKLVLSLHVVDHRQVHLISTLNHFRQREVLAIAEPAAPPTSGFGAWHDHEAFCIWLQSRFVGTDELKALLKAVSKIEAGSIRTSDDDGVTQSVAAKRGTTLVERALLPPRVTLFPFRTFPECDQPASEFVLRARGGGEGQTPTLALFEADGGAWIPLAIESVARYLKESLDDNSKLTVIA